VPERLREISRRAEVQLAERGIELVRTDPVFGEGEEVERAIRELAAGEWDFLIANVINWIEVRAATRVLLAFRDRPVLLYSLGGFTEGDTLISPAAGAGSTALRFPLERWHFKFKYLFNAPDSPMDLDGIERFGRAARAAKALRSSRLGMIGFNDMGLYTTDFSVVRLRDIIGPEVESLDLLQLSHKMDGLPTSAVREETQRVTKDWEYPLGKPSDEVIERAVRLYMATMEICREKHFDAFSYKCVDGVDLEMQLTHAVPSALVASADIPYVDENDIGNLTAELMLKYLSGNQVMFLEHYEHHPEWILMGEDGYIPNDFIEGKPQIKDVSTVLLGGIAHCSKMKKGRMTLACLAEDDDGFRMHIVTGEAKQPPQWVEMGVPLPSWPSVRFFPDVPVRRILDHVLSQHFAAVRGDFAGELLDLCSLLGIKVVYDGRPID
jgi:L-fucose isomerase-like protein